MQIVAFLHPLWWFQGHGSSEGYEFVGMDCTPRVDFLMISEIQDPMSTIEFFRQRSPIISKETFGWKIFAGSFKKCGVAIVRFQKTMIHAGKYTMHGPYLYLGIHSYCQRIIAVSNHLRHA